MSMPPEGFAMATTLIEQAIGTDAWTQLAADVPEAIGA
jgi:hypothetical protein